MSKKFCYDNKTDVGVRPEHVKNDAIKKATFCVIAYNSSPHEDGVGFILATASEQTYTIDVFCAQQGHGPGLLEWFLEYAREDDKDVHLDALKNVLGYYSKDKFGFQFRKSCSPTEKVLDASSIVGKRPSLPLSKDSAFAPFLEVLQKNGFNVQKKKPCDNKNLSASEILDKNCDIDGYTMFRCLASSKGSAPRAAPRKSPKAPKGKAVVTPAKVQEPIVIEESSEEESEEEESEESEEEESEEEEFAEKNKDAIRAVIENPSLENLHKFIKPHVPAVTIKEEEDISTMFQFPRKEAKRMFSSSNSNDCLTHSFLTVTCPNFRSLPQAKKDIVASIVRRRIFPNIQNKFTDSNHSRYITPKILKQFRRDCKTQGFLSDDDARTIANFFMINILLLEPLRKEGRIISPPSAFLLNAVSTYPTYVIYGSGAHFSGVAIKGKYVYPYDDAVEKVGNIIETNRTRADVKCAFKSNDIVLYNDNIYTVIDRNFNNYQECIELILQAGNNIITVKPSDVTPVK